MIACAIKQSLGSPLVIVGECFELGRNHSVRHDFNGAKQGPGSPQTFLASP